MQTIRPWSPLAVLLAFFIPPAVAAQTTLRWNLQPGEKLSLTTAQKTTSDVAYAGKKTATQMELSVELQWQVLAAQAGKMQIKQTVSRIVSEVALADGSRVLYDSAQAARPTGRARELAAAAAPLLAAAVEVTLSDRGEMLDVKPAARTGDPPAPPGSASSQPLLAKETIQQLLRQPLLILPERPVSAGDSWQAEATLDTALGNARLTTTYRLAEPVEQDGKQLARIETSAAIQLEDAGAARKLQIKEHQQRGTILFDSTAGRLVSAEQTQKLVTERPYRETTIVVSLTSEQRTVVTPVAGGERAP